MWQTFKDSYNPFKRYIYAFRVLLLWKESFSEMISPRKESQVRNCCPLSWVNGWSAWYAPCSLRLGSTRCSGLIPGTCWARSLLQTLSGAFCIAWRGRRMHSSLCGVGRDLWVLSAGLILLRDIFMGFVSSLCTWVRTPLPGLEPWLHFLPLYLGHVA